MRLNQGAGLWTLGQSVLAVGLPGAALAAAAQLSGLDDRPPIAPPGRHRRRNDSRFATYRHNAKCDRVRRGERLP